VVLCASTSLEIRVVELQNRPFANAARALLSSAFVEARSGSLHCSDEANVQSIRSFLNRTLLRESHDKHEVLNLVNNYLGVSEDELTAESCAQYSRGGELMPVFGAEIRVFAGVGRSEYLVCTRTLLSAEQATAVASDDSAAALVRACSVLLDGLSTEWRALKPGTRLKVGAAYMSVPCLLNPVVRL
jgi:hypothetical protein